MKVRAKRDPSAVCSACFVCGMWSWTVSRVGAFGSVELCLECYVDVLEIRQARGVMGEPSEASVGRAIAEREDSARGPGSSPSPVPRQFDLFDA